MELKEIGSTTGQTQNAVKLPADIPFFRGSHMETPQIFVNICTDVVLHLGNFLIGDPALKTDLCSAVSILAVKHFDCHGLSVQTYPGIPAISQNRKLNAFLTLILGNFRFCQFVNCLPAKYRCIIMLGILNLKDAVFPHQIDTPVFSVTELDLDAGTLLHIGITV